MSTTIPSAPATLALPAAMQAAPATATAIATGTGGDDPAKLRKVARQFEAIFVRQMLAEARKTNLDPDGIFSNQGTQTFRDMQDQRFADIAADKGTFGLAHMIEKQLTARAAVTPAAPAPAKEQ